MTPTTIFLDTEFSNLDSPSLISIGLVSDEGQEFYAELTDGWRLQDCSLFTLAQVLPLLNEGRFEAALEEAFGSRLAILRLITDERDSREAMKDEGYMEMVRNCPPEEWEWAEGLPARGPDPGHLRVAQVPELAEKADQLDIASVLSEDQALSYREAACALADWIAAVPGEVHLLGDDYFDRLLVGRLLRASGRYPENLSVLPLVYPRGIDPIVHAEIEEARNRYLAESGRRHHALVDARGLRLVWQMAKEKGVL